MQRTASRRRLGVAAVGVLLALLLWSGLFVDRYSGAPAAAEQCQVRAAVSPAPTAPPRVAEAYPRWLSQERGTVNDVSCLNPAPVTRPELFRAVIGGYGLFGVIVEAELSLVPSEMYRLTQRTVPTADFPATFDQLIAPDPRHRLMFGHLSTSPASLLDEVIVYTYETTEWYDEPLPPLKAGQDSRVARFLLNLARHGGLGQRIKWAAQEHVLPRFRSCHEPRNEGLRAAEACFVSRNQAMYNDLGLLRHRLTRYTDVLQEYFLPHEQLVPFLALARTHLEGHDAELLSASVRVVHDEDVLLDYARGERFSVVLYLSQRVGTAGVRDMAHLTRALVDTALDHDGTFYLPYQQHYTRAQLERAYPMVDDFFALKARHDPDLLFRNSFYDRYADPGPTGRGSAPESTDEGHPGA